MNKEIYKKILFVFLAILCLQEDVFAGKMVKVGDTNYYFDDKDNMCTNKLYDSGKGTFYFGDDGKMVVGWYRHPISKKIYFFTNNPNATLGAMVFGYNYIDGYLRYFYPNGTMAISNTDRMADVNGSYVVDNNGFLYDKNGNLMRDISENRSEFYTDLNYYKDLSLNNKTLAETGIIGSWSGNKTVMTPEQLKIYQAEQSAKAKQIFNGKATDDSNVVVSSKVK